MKYERAHQAFRVALMLAAASCAAKSGSQVIFDTPEEAAKVLVGALASDDCHFFLSVAGPQMAGFWTSGDPERDTWDRRVFLDAAQRNGIQTDSVSESRKLLLVRTIEQPFPAPLVKTEAGWRFDDAAGSQEMARRRIRRNETAAVEQCLRFREAEYEYRAGIKEGERTFALKIRSTPGQHDGLFWTGGDEEDQSPLGPPFASAAFAEQQPGKPARPLFGYYFKILWAQGRDAAGGALDYRSRGQLRKGFALVAWPAGYGVDGIETFLINHFGDIYGRDLGPDTTRLAENMTAFNPDRAWSRWHALD